MALLAVGITAFWSYSGTDIFAAAARAKLNYKAASIHQGKSLQLKVTGSKYKAKWTSSNRSVVTVTTAGKITGKKVGKAVVRAKVKGRTMTCTVTVLTPPPAQGSRQKPANARAGVTLDLIHGKVSYKLKAVWRGVDAQARMVALKEWDGVDVDELAQYPNMTLTFFEWDVKTLGGFAHEPLRGDDIIHPWELFDYNMTKKIGPFAVNYLTGKNAAKDRSVASLTGVTSGKMYMALYLPPDLTAFSTRLSESGKREFWVRYTL